MRARRVLRLLLAAALLWVPVAVSATPVLYGFTSGSVTVSASTLIGTTLTPISINGGSSVNVGLTGTSITFDSGAVPGNAITGFSFVTSPTGTLSLSPPVGTVTSVSFSALTIVPGSGYSSTVTGTGPYNFSLTGPFAVSGSISVNGNPSSLFNFPGGSGAGQVNLGTNTILLNGITLWQTNIPGGKLLIKGDFVFHGVPEPGMAVLIACAGAVLAARARRG